MPLSSLIRRMLLFAYRFYRLRGKYSTCRRRNSGVQYTGIPHGKLAMDIVVPKTPGAHPASFTAADSAAVNGKVWRRLRRDWLGTVTLQQLAAIGRLKEANAARTIDAKGKFVSPGFIDMHSHAYGGLAQDARRSSRDGSRAIAVEGHL